jgi:phospholipid/cholesterol/gamma-HCH transport system ATP-binding protein
MLRSLVDELGMTVLIVTHDLDTLLNVVDRVIVLGAGKLIMQGSIEEVVNSEDAWIKEYFSVRTQIHHGT